MSGFVLPPTFAPAVYGIPLGTDGQVLTMVGGVPRFADGGGGGGGIGDYLYAAPAAGSYADYDPDGFGDSIGRLDVDTTAGDVTIESLIAGSDAQLLIIANVGANVLILQSPGFRLPADLQLPQYGAQLICYYAGEVDLWCGA